MKKGIFALVLAVMLAGNVFAQSGGQFDLQSGPSPQKNAVFVDFGPTLAGLLLGGFGIGLGYERPLTDMFSFVVHGDVLAFSLDSSWYKYDALAFDIDAHGRWYPFKTALGKLFVDLGVGFGYVGYSYEYSASPDEKYSVSLLSIGAKVGWKFMWTSFFLEPSFGYTYPIELSNDVASGLDVTYSKGLAFGLSLGWAF